MTNTSYVVQLCTVDVCQSVAIHEELLCELVDYGIVDPQGDEPVNWQFDADMLGRVKQALRLRRELEIDWAGVAVALDLMQEVQQLRAENLQLRQRLARFLHE